MKKIILLTILAMILIAGQSFAIEVDIYQYMGSGNPGDLLTPQMMKASSIGGIANLPVPDWELIVGDSSNSSSGVWVSSDYTRQLPGKVTVDGVDYSGMSSYTWSTYYKWKTNYIALKFGENRQWIHTPYHPSMTVACFYTPGTWFPSSSMYLDTIIIGGTVTQNGPNSQYNYSVFSVQNGTDNTTVNVSVHTEKGSGTRISLISGHTYWVNLHYNGPEGKGKLAVFDPDNGWAQVGQTSELELQAVSNPLNSQVKSRVKIGRCDTHADYTSDSNPQSYFSHIMVDYTHAKFPLLPGGIGVIVTEPPATPTGLKLLK